MHIMRPLKQKLCPIFPRCNSHLIMIKPSHCLQSHSRINYFFIYWCFIFNSLILTSVTFAAMSRILKRKTEGYMTLSVEICIAENSSAYCYFHQWSYQRSHLKAAFNSIALNGTEDHFPCCAVTVITSFCFQDTQSQQHNAIGELSCHSIDAPHLQGKFACAEPSVLLPLSIRANLNLGFLKVHCCCIIDVFGLHHSEAWSPWEDNVLFCEEQASALLAQVMSVMFLGQKYFSSAFSLKFQI